MSMDRWRGLALACALCGCSESNPTADPKDAGPTDSGRLLADPLITPERYDCRVAGRTLSRPTGAPELGCAFDPECHERLVVAHRSGGGTSPGLGVIAPENTLSALRAAIVLGVDFIETDPRMTADGDYVNVHDPSLSGTTTSTRAVTDMTLAEIQELPIRYPSTVVGDFSCDRVISIEELLVAAKGQINVLLDANKIPLEGVDGLVELIRKTDTFDWAVFDTSSLEKVARARALEANIRVHIRPDAPEDIEGQIAAVGEPAPVILELDVPDLEAGARIVHERLPGARVMVDGLGPLDLQAAIDGKADSLVALYEMGADMIQTDRPDLLLKGLGRLP